MRDSDIPVKTEAGRRELGERRLALHPRQRALLIAIHGEHTIGVLRRQFQALGPVESILDELETAALIEPLRATVAPPPSSAPPAPPSSRQPFVHDDDVMTPLQAARQFMNETAVATLGLRAFLFTLKLEKCYSRDELIALLPEYRRVLGKARNEGFADAMRDRAQALIARA
jgi:hypothetical protein